MRLELAYGKGSQIADLNFATHVRFLDAPEISPTGDPEQIVRQALTHPIACKPLNEILHKGERTTVVVPDNSRVAGLKVYLPILLDVLNRSGIGDADITVLIACGSHPLPTEVETRELVGTDVFDRVHVLAHNCRDPEANVYLGQTSKGVFVALNKAVVKAERLIVTGAVWFHYFAGFGGGAKLINPGCAAYDTIAANHSFTLDPDQVGLHPACRSANTKENPVFEDLLDSMKFVTVDFCLQTLMGRRNQLARAWSGSLQQVHQRIVAFLRKRASVPKSAPYPLVVASAGGNPHDINLVQAHKSFVNATAFLGDGGCLVMVAECAGGAGSWGLEQSLQYLNAESLYRSLRQEFVLNGNTALSLLLKAQTYTIVLVSDLPPEWLKRIGIRPAHDLSEALVMAREKTGDVDEALVLPDAAHTVSLA